MEEQNGCNHHQGSTSAPLHHYGCSSLRAHSGQPDFGQHRYLPYHVHTVLLRSLTSSCIASPIHVRVVTFSEPATHEKASWHPTLMP
ncbi:hypothetical protein ACOMHN_006191 [Nucella lapillus]